MADLISSPARAVYTITEEGKKVLENPSERPHSMALSYASKKVKDLKAKYETAVKLWA